jgi:MoxR-like ATPase
MSERQVTVEGQRREMARPFFVIATQNPSEFHGTYPLPEAQLDRFTACVSLGYPAFDSELEILYSQNERHPLDDLQPVVTCSEVVALMEDVKKVRFDRAVAEYLVRLVGATRDDPRLRLGLSPRGSLALYRTAQARARLSGRDYVLPEDIRALAAPVLAHRLMLDTKSKYGGVRPPQIVAEHLEKVPVPR